MGRMSRSYEPGGRVSATHHRATTSQPKHANNIAQRVFIANLPPFGTFTKGGIACRGGRQQLPSWLSRGRPEIYKESSADSEGSCMFRGLHYRAVRTGGPMLLLFAGAVTPTVSATEPPAKVDFAHNVVPILKAHCVECHGGRRHEGDF